MNNILSFNEYNGQELEVIAYENVLNEKSSTGKGIRGFINRRAASKVRSELEEEIELSKSIMEGIKEGLESISEGFDSIQKSLDNTDNDKKKGEKQKLLDDITKILENSKKSTWDLNELIDEGEIDYTGFTANVAISSVAYFGILLTPFRATVMIHKGYKYFFNIVKNTIRKALVMLQLNFDQFSNLIVTQSLRCAGVITATDTSSDIGEFYGNICAQIAENKSMSKRQLEKVKNLLSAAKQKFDQQARADKMRDAAENLYNNIDPYANTYTKSLETLRQYSSDDVQKNLDAIKASMNKLAGQEADLQVYSELLIAAAEEHAYEVSTSIYNKFAKMTEVFSLPNQKKLIDLILEANKEQKAEAKRLKNEKQKAEEFKAAEEKEEKGIEIFKSIEGVEIGKFDNETKKFDESEIKGAKKWTYDKLNGLKDDDKELFSNWLCSHPEVLKQCSKTLQISISSVYNEGYHMYVDSIIDYVGRCLVESSDKNESIILNFDSYLLEGKMTKDGYKLDKSEKKLLNSKFNDALDKIAEKIDSESEDSDYDAASYAIDELLKIAIGDDYEEKINNKNYTDEEYAKLIYILDLYKEKEEESIYNQDVADELKNRQKKMDISKSSKRYYFDLNKLDKHQVDDLKDLYQGKVNEKVASVALEVIGNKLLKDKTFVKNRKNIIDIINKSFDEETVTLSMMTYELLKDAKEELKDIRSHDYNMEDEEDTKNGEK